MRRSLGESLLFSAFIVIMLMLPGFIDQLEPFQQLCITLIVNALLFLYLFYRHSSQGEFRRNKQELNKKHFLILLPVCVPLVILFLIFVFNGTLDALSLLWIFSYELDVLESLFAARLLAVVEFLLIALIDEMVFRMFFFKLIRINNRGLKIIISGAIFALFDLLLLFQKVVLFRTVALSMVVSFLLGVVLGAIVEYGHCVYIAFAYHFLFELTYWGYSSNFADRFDGIYWYANPIIWLSICVVYLVIIYFVYFRKKEYSNVQ